MRFIPTISLTCKKNSMNIVKHRYHAACGVFIPFLLLGIILSSVIACQEESTVFQPHPQIYPIETQFKKNLEAIYINPKDTSYNKEAFVPYGSYQIHIAGGKENGDSFLVKIPKSGSYYLGIIMIDRPEYIEQLSILYDGKEWGRILGDYNDGVKRFFFSPKPLALEKDRQITCKVIQGLENYYIGSIWLIPKPLELPQNQIKFINTQYHPDTRSLRMSWVNTIHSNAEIRFGTSKDRLDQTIQTRGLDRLVHEVELSRLEPQTTYYYQIICRDKKQLYPVQSEILSFKTEQPTLGTCPDELRQIPFTITEPTIHERSHGYVSQGIPFQRSVLANETNVQIKTSTGILIPSQREPLAYWEDGSIKWLRITFLPEQSSIEGNSYYMEYGNAIQHPQPRSIVSIEQEGHDYRLKNEHLEFSWNSIKHSPDSKVTALFNTMIILNLRGDIQATAQDPTFVTIEEEGPLACTLRYEGEIKTLDTAQHAGKYIMRARLIAGVPWVFLSWTYGNDVPLIEKKETSYIKDEFLLVKSVAFRITPKHQRLTQIQLGDLPPTEVEVNDSLDILQYDANAYTYTFGEETTNVADSQQNIPGVLSLVFEQSTLQFSIPYFRETYPNGFHIQVPYTDIMLLPELPEDLYSDQSQEVRDRLYYWYEQGFYKLEQGMQVYKDWSIVLPQTETYDPKILSQWTEHPLLMVFPSKYLTSAKVFGSMAPYEEDNYPKIETLFKQGFAHFKENIDQFQAYGFLNYGDWFGERDKNWGNQEYDMQQLMAVYFHRMGNQELYEWGYQAALHHSHIDCLHYAKRPEEVGKVYGHGMGHTGYFDSEYQDMGAYASGYLGDPGHTIMEGNFSYSMLTGEKRFYEPALASAYWLANSKTNYFRFGIEREAGWSLLNLLSAYHASGNPYFLNAAHIIMQHVIDIFEWRVLFDLDFDVLPIPVYESKTTPKCLGAKAFSMGMLFHAIIRYLETTEIEALESLDHAYIEEMMALLARGVIQGSWDATVKGFRYTTCPQDDIPPHSKPGRNLDLFGQGLAHVYNTHPDFRLIQSVVESGGMNILYSDESQIDPTQRALGKRFTQLFKTAPYMLYELAKSEFTELP